MGIISKIFGKQNDINRIKISQLQEEEILLKNRINRLRKDLEEIEISKKRLFDSGVGADYLKKKMLAQELKQLDLNGKLKIKNFLTLHKQYMFVSNLITIKKYQRDLETTAVWNEIQKITPDAFESALIHVNLSGKTFENVVDDLNRIFAMDVADSESSMDDAEKQMFDVWNKVEAGALDLECAKDLFSLNKDLEKTLETPI